MDGEGLDAEKLQVLTRWAEGLRADPRPELAAAGRAIEMLVEEVERLHVLAWGKQLYPEPTTPDDGVAGAATEESHSAVTDDAVHAPMWRTVLRRVHNPRPSDS